MALAIVHSNVCKSLPPVILMFKTFAILSNAILSKSQKPHMAAFFARDIRSSPSMKGLTPVGDIVHLSASWFLGPFHFMELTKRRAGSVMSKMVIIVGKNSFWLSITACVFSLARHGLTVHGHTSTVD